MHTHPYDDRYPPPYGYSRPRHPTQTSEIPALITALSNFMKNMTPQPPGNLSSGLETIVAQQSQESQNLWKELSEQKLTALEKEIAHLKENQQTIHNQYSVLETWIRTTGGALGRYFVDSGLEPVKKSREKIGDTSIVDMLPPDFVESEEEEVD